MDKEYYLKSMTNLNVSEEAGKKMDAVRAAYHGVIEAIFETMPNSRERAKTLTELETSLMWAIKAIVLEDNEGGD